MSNKDEKSVEATEKHQLSFYFVHKDIEGVLRIIQPSGHRGHRTSLLVITFCGVTKKVKFSVHLQLVSPTFELE